MFEFIGNVRIWHELNKNLKELDSIQKKAQRIDGKLQKYMEENEQVLANEDKNVITMLANNQKNKIINEIKDLEESSNQSLEKTFNQLTQQKENRQLVHIPDEQNGKDLGNNLITIQALASRNYTRNKTVSEYLRGVPRGDFGRKRLDGSAIAEALLLILPIVAELVDETIRSHVEGLARRYEEELKKTQEFLVELREKTERYYSRITPTSSKNKLLLISGFILFIVLLISWYFLGLF